jgi:copper transport protein
VRRIALIAAAVASLALPAAAEAHATLEGTAPQRGARLAKAPAQVVFRFDESVNTSLGGAKVFDAKGEQVQQGAAFHPDGRGDEVAVRLRSGLEEGGYTATYRVISADSHPVSGGFTFTVGGGGAGSASVADLLKGQSAGPVTSTALSAARAVGYAAIALGLGTIVFLLVCWLPAVAARAGADAAWTAATAAFAARVRVLLTAAAGAGIVAGVLAILLEGAQGAGEPLWSALDAQVIGDVLRTRYGVTWAAAIAGWLVVGVWALARPAAVPALRPASVGASGVALPRSRLWVPAVPLAAMTLVPALAGHASVESPVALLLPANVLHVAAMSAWLGGIAVLVLGLRTATRRLAADDRMPVLALVVARFSTMAGIAFTVVFASGVAQAFVEVGRFGALTDTAFGRAVLIKLVLFGALVLLGWTNRTKILPELRAGPRAGVLLRRTLRFELALGVAVLAVTGALAGYPPSKAVSSGPVTREADVGNAHLQLTVDPGTVGANALHVYLFDHHSGAQFTGAKEVRVTASLPAKGIDSLPVTVRSGGPGHYLGSASLPAKGDWRLTVTVRTSQFDESAARLKIPIR